MELSLLDRRWNCVRARIVAMRKAAGMSQRALAAAIRSPRSLVSRIELGERRVDLVEFLVIADALGADAPEEAQQLMQDMIDAVSAGRRRTKRRTSKRRDD